jgi:hypothetical protein
MFISGPRTATLGSEQGTTSCMLLAGQGGDHLTSSMIYHSSTATCIPNTLAGGVACFSGAVCAQGAQFSGKTNVVKDIADYTFTITNPNTDGYGMYIQAGNTNNAIDVYNAAGTTQIFNLTGTGLACFASTVIAGGNILIDNSTASKKGYTYRSPASNWGPQTSGIYFNPIDGANATPTVTVNLWNGTFGTAGYGGFTDVLTINGAGGTATFSGNVCAPAFIGGTVDGSIINSTSNAFRFSGNNALSLVSLCSQNVVKINAAGYWGVQLVGANDKGILIDNTGLVGIGTISPTRALTVSGKGQFTSTSNTNELYLADACTSIIDNQWVGSIGNSITIGAGGSHRMNISSTGIACFACQVCAPTFVGGTATFGSGAGTCINITTNSNNGTSGSPLQTSLNFRGLNNNLNGQIRVDDISGTVQIGSMQFYTWNSAQVSALTLCHNAAAVFYGQVSAPTILANGCIMGCTAVLQVPSTNAVIDILRLNNPSVTSSGTRIKFENGYGDLAAIRVIHRDNGSLADDGQIEFQVGSNSSLDTKMTILNTGNVGIGTTNPSDRLTITDASTYTFNIGAASGGAGAVLYTLGSASLILATCGSSNERVRITSTGAIGIKNTSPSDFGSGYANMTLGSSGNIGYFSVTNGTINVEINADGGGNVRTRSNHDLVFGTNETARARITAAGIACFACTVCAPTAIFTGCVGIGQTSPAFGLEVYSSRQTAITSDNTFGANFNVIFNRDNTGGTRNCFNLLADQNAAYLRTLDNFPMVFVTAGSDRARIAANGVTTFACQVCSPILIAGSVLAIQGNCSAGICFYKDYSGSPGNPGMTIYNNSGTLTFQHNSNGGTTTMQGNVRINGVGNQLTFDTTDGANTIELGTVSDYVFRLRNYRGVGSIMDLGNNYIDFYTNGSLRQRIFDYGVTCFAGTVCAPSFSTPGFLRAHSSMKTFHIQKNLDERLSNSDYFRIASTSGGGFQVIVHSFSQNVGVGWSQSQIFHAVNAPYWGGWVGTSTAVSTIGDGSGIISSAVIGQDGTITFRVSTGNNGTNTQGTINSFIQVNAFNIDGITLTAL